MNRRVSKTLKRIASKLSTDDDKTQSKRHTSVDRDKKRVLSRYQRFYKKGSAVAIYRDFKRNYRKGYLLLEGNDGIKRWTSLRKFATQTGVRYG